MKSGYPMKSGEKSERHGGGDLEGWGDRRSQGTKAGLAILDEGIGFWILTVGEALMDSPRWGRAARSARI
jgi:hypothetical protein